ncbi:MAG: c-type cytochrome [Myxococcales bacterium]|nr:c-type cytochrome [Myxococcales bacterium]MCB9712339.1 c-type cytochrome [Myxococcales bacterium]
MKRIVTLCALSFLAAACGGDGGDEGKSKADPAVVAEAQKVWKDKCVTCHGNTGHGDGPGAAALNPKPRTFKDPKWQTYTKDDRIAKVIVEGGVSVGLSEGMAPNPELKDKPEVVAELVKIVRSFK